MNKCSSGSVIVYGLHICFMLTKFPPAFAFSFNVAVTSDPTVNATGPMTSASVLTERTLGERMCAQKSQV